MKVSESYRARFPIILSPEQKARDMAALLALSTPARNLLELFLDLEFETKKLLNRRSEFDLVLGCNLIRSATVMRKKF